MGASCGSILRFRALPQQQAQTGAGGQLNGGLQAVRELARAPLHPVLLSWQ